VQVRPDEPSRAGRRLVAVVPQKLPLLQGTGANKAQAPLRGSPDAATWPSLRKEIQVQFQTLRDKILFRRR
jgi:hypothetical protein